MRKQIQVTLGIHGEAVQVDEGVRDLVMLMNRVVDLITLNSCQGDKSEPARFAYIQFTGRGALDLLPSIAAGILKEQQSWKKKHQHICHGCPGMSVSLEKNSTGIALRWLPRDYSRIKRVLTVACGE